MNNDVVVPEWVAIMTVETPDPLPAPLQSIATSLTATKTRGPAPVDQWHPPFCGFIDLRIAADGAWYYGGTKIQRPALVALFASILRKDPDHYVLVTPVECVGITVEDAPFIATGMARDAGTLVISTNMGDEVRAGPGHPLRFALDETGGVKPYVLVRGGLWARFTRALALDLIDLATERNARLGVETGGAFFPLEPDVAETQAI